MELQQYISNAFPEGLPYNEAAQLCLRLYCSVDGVPSEFHTQCTINGLAVVFSRLADAGFVKEPTQSAALCGANFHAVNEKGHWVEVIASIFKKGDTVDMLLGKSLVRRLIR